MIYPQFGMGSEALNVMGWTRRESDRIEQRVT